MKQGGGDDEQLCSAWGKVGMYYTERGKWGKAAQYFKQAKDLGMMAECYYRYIDETAALENMIREEQCSVRTGRLGFEVVASRALFM